MSKVLQRVDVTLRSFYVFNSHYGQKEGDEHKKILYYYPDDIELNTKIKDVGLSEAIIAFTGTFTSDDDGCKALHTQKTTQLFHQPEPGYWLVLVINVPKEIRSKDSVDVAEYCGGEVSDRIYRAVIEQCYNMFRLFMGTFQMIVGKREGDIARVQLQQRLAEFFDKHLHTLRWPACDITDMMRSIQYLPLDKILFLRAHNFINMIRATFPVIEETILLYNEQVVCSGKLDARDLYCLHEHLVAKVLAKDKSTTPTVGLLRSNSATVDAYRNGAFITGTQDASEPPTKVYLQESAGGSTLQPYYLLIYRALHATLCLFLKAHDEPQPDFYTELHSYMGPQLTSLARDIGETLVAKKQTPLAAAAAAAASSATPASVAVTDATTSSDATTPKYLFINEQSLKHLSNIASDRHRPKVPTLSIPSHVMNLIADLNSDNGHANPASATPAFEEVQLKTTNDFWIVKRRCNWRQYYVIIYNSKATLLDVTHEATRIFDQELTDDVFFDK